MSPARAGDGIPAICLRHELETVYQRIVTMTGRPDCPLAVLFVAEPEQDIFVEHSTR